MSPEQAVAADCKEYEEAGSRFSVAQIEDSASRISRKKRTPSSRRSKISAPIAGCFFSACSSRIINTQNSVLIARGDESFTRHIDYPELEPHLWQLDGVVSRKKQAPPLPHEPARADGVNIASVWNALSQCVSLKPRVARVIALQRVRAKRSDSVRRRLFCAEARVSRT